MNKQKFVAELSRLLGFMSSRDRQAVIEKYNEMFDQAENEAVLLAELGSPTKLAIRLAREYVPSPVEVPEDEDGQLPESAEEAAPQTGSEDIQALFEETPRPDVDAGEDSADAAAEETAEESSEESAAAENAPEEPVPHDEGPVFDSDAAVSPAIMESISGAVDRSVQADGPSGTEEFPEAPLVEPGDEPEHTAEAPAKKRRVRPVPLIFYILASLVIGLPIAVVLIVLGIPFLALGLGIAVGAVWTAVQLFSLLAMISDILLVAGAALIAAAVGLLLAWLGLWISLELGYLWIGRVIFRLGGKLCFKKEEPDND